MNTKTATKKLSALENAQKIVNELQAKHTAVAAARANDEAEMGAIAYLAHTGDEKAAAKLETLKERALRRNLELDSIASAIAVAKQNVEAAKQAESQTQARKVARELLKRANAIVKHAQTLDDANRIRVEALHAVAGELTEMRSLAHGLGVFVPSHDQFTALASRAELTSAMATPVAREIGEHVPPNQRRDHMSYIAQWRDAIAKAAAAILGEDKREAA